MQRFNIVIAKPDGGVEIHRMKEWLRQHPDRVPAGLHPTNSTSHQLRDGLKRQGWAVRETPSEVRLIMPEAIGREAGIDDVIGPVEAAEQDLETPDVAFALEYQLRDFIARNLGALIVNDRRLRLFVDATGRDGVEFPTAVGPIDILALISKAPFSSSSSSGLQRLTRPSASLPATWGGSSRRLGKIEKSTASL